MKSPMLHAGVLIQFIIAGVRFAVCWPAFINAAVATDQK